jgi:DNA-binding GntR family transcriptional regulator
MPLPAIARTNLRCTIRDRLLDGLMRGGLAPGVSLNEPALAAELGVSRTPLREALVALTHEGFLHAHPGRGFFATPLRASEAEEIYPIVWTLEGLALRLAAPLPPAQVDQLERLNARLAKTADAWRALGLDRQWHAELLSGCPNRRLLQNLDTLKAQAFRYEYAYFRDSGRIVTSSDQHEAILASVRAGKLDGALARLEGNWRVSLEFLRPWLAAGSGTQ